MLENYNEKIIEIINRITKEEKNAIKEAGKLLFETMEKGKIVHVFATGHSHMFCEELFYRACGLVQINPILIPELMQHVGAITSTKLERKEGLAEEIFDKLNLEEDEPFIIVSNSGINAVPVEMAMICRKNGHKVICVTSMDTSVNSSPRNKYNKHLYEVSDIVIDNHVPKGDGVITKEYGQVGASSSIAGNFIAQSLVLEVINNYEEENKTPPIFVSANLPNGDEHNKKLITKYQSRINPLR